ncbi:MAG TPA: cytochrome ubiquinol oxidase subunit I [Thermoplasmataceae archaeon]|nr:cytochrome ubiquinol oxidase subunit I [Thermoplasmatales archaeon AK]HLH86471.1 cytochrome ubiquinol oxidase subunit I [Thermoplasmataceae archaeon]
MVSVIDFDRILMGFTLGAHILIVTLSISLAVIISAAEFIGLKRKDVYFESLARRLAKALVIFFAVGTASGTVLAVELFSLWPAFMVFIAKIDILPFYYEVFAFFLETISLVLYVYYWDAFHNRYRHWALSLFVAIGTVMSAVFITMINAFMNTPAGFTIVNGEPTDINPLAAVMAPSGFFEISHVVTTTLAAGSFLLLAYLAFSYLRNHTQDSKIFYRKAITLTSVVGFIALALAGITGDSNARMLISMQPLKYAAIELNMYPTDNASEIIGGIMVNGHLEYYISIPHLQSILAFLTLNSKTVVPGLSQFPSSLWPPLFVHLTFDVMVGGGILVGLFSLYLMYSIIRKRDPTGRFSLYGMMVAGALIEVVDDAGWVTDEVGRQPWIIYNVMTVSQAANTSPSVIPLGIAIIVFYLIIVPFTFYFAAKVLRQERVEEELEKSRGSEWYRSFIQK